MSAEGAYRAALRWYPARWRRVNEDVLVGTLLDVADAEGRSAPTHTELRDLRRAGLAARADVVLPGAIRDRVAATSLGAGTALALALLTGQVWGAWNAQGSPAQPTPDGIVWQVLIHPGLWVLAALAALAGWTVLARVLLLATLPASLIAFVATDVSFLLRPSFFTMVVMAVLALMSCVGRPPRRWQLIATATTLVATASWLTFLGPFAGTYFPRGGIVDFIGSPWPVAVLLGVGVAAAVRGRRLAVAALLVAAIPWLVLLAGDFVWFNSSLFGWPGVFIASAIVVVVIPAVVLLVVRFVPRRREPAAPVR